MGADNLRDQFTIHSSAQVRELSGLDNSNPSEKIVKVSSLSNDLPVAQRERSSNPPVTKNSRLPLYAGLATTALVALAAGGIVSWQLRQPQAEVVNSANTSGESLGTDQTAKPPATEGSETLLNHFSYPEAPATDLETAQGNIKLRKAAARAYRQMVVAARQSGVDITLISGFRSIADQKYLYFDVKAERGQNASERAKVSAPPGYSEHHTGYAIDVGDSFVSATNLRQDFDKTPAFRWLRANAARYSFELSFPKNNPQGVSYEPWHWRYVGDIQSLKVFYKARGK
jgi:D-alanyl-D-alanine carboxypeptidase